MCHRLSEKHLVVGDPACRTGIGTVGPGAPALRRARRHPAEPVTIDLLGPVPADGYLWVRSQVERAGKQIELISAEMLTLDPSGQPRPAARASGWRLQQLDTADVVHTAAAALRPLSEARIHNSEKDWDRNYVHSLDWRWLTPRLNEGPGEAWIKPTVDLVYGETMTQLERLQIGHHQMDVPEQ